MKTILPATLKQAFSLSMKVADSMRTGSINHHLVNKWDKKKYPVIL